MPKAQLAAAEQNVLQLKAALDAATSSVAQAKAQRDGLKAALTAATANVADVRAKRELARFNLEIADAVAKGEAGAISKLRLDQARAGMAEADAADVELAAFESSVTDWEKIRGFERL